jgi:hypothetical protein
VPLYLGVSALRLPRKTIRIMPAATSPIPPAAGRAASLPVAASWRGAVLPEDTVTAADGAAADVGVVATWVWTV